ncbi:MAG: DUF362 domain-containing protein [Candidatus Omnitrophica bacterium]|nr:DUF362 domain-containing protein [Candidatus Omnitrophota bacterium]
MDRNFTPEKALSKFQEILKKEFSRRGFVKALFFAALALLSRSFFPKRVFALPRETAGRAGKRIKAAHDLAVVKGKDPYTNTEKAVNALGGMGLFVKPGDVVVVKPNIAWDRTPQQAANTDPGVVAALVSMCYAAGAKKVKVFDITCNNEQRCYSNSGIAEAARNKGASVFFADSWNIVKARFPYPSQMEGWPIVRDAVECDVFINVPVLKHHGLTGLTLSMKNLMGVCAGTRGLIHINIGRKLVDLTDYISPDLTVIDASRVLVRHGPSGGSLEDVVAMDTVIAGTDPVLADTYACTLVDRDPMSVPYIKEAVSRKFGSTDIAGADILKTG